MGLLASLLGVEMRPLTWEQAGAAIALYEAAIQCDVDADWVDSAWERRQLRAQAEELRRRFDRAARGYTIGELDVIHARGGE
jgi:hypothetical protein